MGDTNEDWSARIGWLSSLIAELWSSRGLYPGLTKVLDYLDFKQAIPFFKERVVAGHEQDTMKTLFAFLNGEARDVPGLEIAADERKRISRRWMLTSEQQRRLLQDVFPRFDLHTGQIERILSYDPRSYGIYSSLENIAVNPYLLSEEFVGDGPDDVITFNKVDHGIFPSPDLGAEALADKDDWRRLRGVCVERLKQEDKHTFMTAEQVIHDVNRKLSFLPEWKRAQFNERYLEVDEEELSSSLTFRRRGGKIYVYLKSVYEAEREIEKHLRSLVNGPDITFRSPVTEGHWEGYLHQPDSPLASAYPDEYEDAIRGQVQVAQRIFVRPLSILSGSAGTGKTTVVKSLIQATEKAHGTGASFQLLAPTGKAADRLREATGKPNSTVHSFIAQRGWLNDNFTYKRTCGTREDGISTYVIDEASMLDLDLVTTLFRAINWAAVQRLILVGDPNQLPPIGRGRFFADVIDWLNDGAPESIGILQTNLRQMENRLNDRGTGILQLASLFERRRQTERKDEEKKAQAEEMLARVQEGGDVDKDLRVLYWNTPEDLAEKLKAGMVSDMEADTGLTFDAERPHEVWNAAFEGGTGAKRPEYMQVMSPYRGEQFGTENLNNILQALINGRWTESIGQLDGVTLFDKVIQYRNRSGRVQVWARNTKVRENERINIYNGQLGFVKPHGFDSKDFMR
jgi:exodeoxyribonuclease V alpha subunit